jgi:hypothetical protein
MLTLIPKNWFSWDFRVLDGEQDIAFIDRDWFRERASFTLDHRTYDVRRTSILRGTFALEQSGVTLAEASKTSAFRRAFEVHFGGHHYRLQAARFFGREFHLLQGGVSVGTVRPRSVLGRSATAEFPERIPREVQLFLVFLVLNLWKRAAERSS